MEIPAPKLNQTYSITNPHYIAPILFRNIPIYFNDFDFCFISTYTNDIKMAV